MNSELKRGKKSILGKLRCYREIYTRIMVVEILEVVLAEEAIQEAVNLEVVLAEEVIQEAVNLEVVLAEVAIQEEVLAEVATQEVVLAVVATLEADIIRVLIWTNTNK